MTPSEQQARVQSYWAKRGFEIKAEIVDTGIAYRVDGSTLKVVRSDMVNGLPLAALAVALHGEQLGPNRATANNGDNNG